MYKSRSDAPSSIETKDDIQQRISSPPQIMRVQTNHIFSMNHHAHKIVHHRQHPHPHDIEAALPNTYRTNVTGQDKLPNQIQVSPSTAAAITNDTQRSLPNNTSSLTETGQYYNMDMEEGIHILKQAQNSLKDADQVAKSSPILLPVVCVSTVMIFVIGLFVLYQAHGSNVEE